MLKDKFENNNMGDFQNLYPLRLGVCEEDDKLMEKYELFLRKSKELNENVKEKIEKPFNTN